MIVDIISNENINQVVNELLFIRGKILNICTACHTQCFYAVPKDVRLNCINFLYWKLQQILFNHSSDINFKNSMNLLKNVLQNRTSFQWMIVLLHQKILYFKNYFLGKT